MQLNNLQKMKGKIVKTLYCFVFSSKNLTTAQHKKTQRNLCLEASG